MYKSLFDYVNNVLTKSTLIQVNRDDMINNSILYYISSIIATKRLKIVSSNSNAFINFFGLTIAPTGYGKDYSLLVLKELYDINIILYSIKNKFKKNNRLYDGQVILEDEQILVPNNYYIPLDGSKEGLLKTASYYSTAMLGCINVESSEIGFEYSNNKEPINELIKLFEYASHNGLNYVNNNYPPIKDVPANLMFVGSYTAFKDNINLHKSFITQLKTGLARRCIFSYYDDESVRKEMKIIKDFTKKIDKDDIVQKMNNIVDFIKEIDSIFINKKEDMILQEYFNTLKQRYIDTGDEIDALLATKYRVVLKIASIKAIIELRDYINEDDIKFAIKINDSSNKAIKQFNTPRRWYKDLYNKLNQLNFMTMSDISDFTGLTKKQIDDELSLLDDYAYWKNRLLRITKRKVSLEDMKLANSLRYIISVANGVFNSKDTLWLPYEVPLFKSDGKKSIEELIKTERAFSLSHFTNNKRDLKYAIEKQNIIAFDIDDSISLEYAKDLFRHYKYLIYTTRNHQKDKHGLICDRFRILLPLKQEVTLDNEQYKATLKNVAEYIGLSVFDTSTLELARLWFGNKEAEIYTNKNGDLFDISCCIADTEVEQEVSVKLKEAKDSLGNIDARIQGTINKTISNGYKNNRNNILFWCACQLLRLECSEEEMEQYVKIANSSLIGGPLKDREVRNIIKSAIRKNR